MKCVCWWLCKDMQEFRIATKVHGKTSCLVLSISLLPCCCPLTCGQKAKCAQSAATAWNAPK